MFNKNFLADGARIINGVGGLVGGSKKEFDEFLSNRIMDKIHEMGYVAQDDYEALRQTVQKLEERITKLEQQGK